MELEPITRKEKIIAGQDLTPITRMEKFLKQYGGGGGGGGSTDAVLYTAQTLTDAQKKQARDNIDAAVADFVVNGTVNSDMTVTLDKTFNQIQAAIKAGKQPVAKWSRGPAVGIMPMVGYNANSVSFMSGMHVDENFVRSQYVSITSAGTVRFYFVNAPAISDSGIMNQVNMSSNPVSDMQIATKQYVDDKECILKSTTPGSTKKFKITVDDSGNISATEVT